MVARKHHAFLPQQRGRSVHALLRRSNIYLQNFAATRTLFNHCLYIILTCYRARAALVMFEGWWRKHPLPMGCEPRSDPDEHGTNCSESSCSIRSQARDGTSSFCILLHASRRQKRASVGICFIVKPSSKQGSWAPQLRGCALERAGDHDDGVMLMSALTSYVSK